MIGRKVILQLLGGRDYERILDIGCGLVRFTDVLRLVTHSKSAWGVDISPTAVAKAAACYPKCKFIALDVAKIDMKMDGFHNDLIIMQEVI